MAKKDNSSYKVIAENRRARFDYEILETFEAGIVLKGSEVKSLRVGKVSIVESHATEKQGEIMIFNMTIQEYMSASHFDHAPKRPRKLLLKKREIRKLIGAITRKGMTMVALRLYFDHRGMAKLTLGLAKGKNKADKRDTEKERDWKRDKERILRHNDR